MKETPYTQIPMLVKYYETIGGLSYQNGTNSVFNYSPVFVQNILIMLSQIK